jgi:hypothetical protein
VAIVSKHFVSVAVASSTLRLRAPDSSISDASSGLFHSHGKALERPQPVCGHRRWRPLPWVGRIPGKDTTLESRRCKGHSGTGARNPGKINLVQATSSVWQGLETTEFCLDEGHTRLPEIFSDKGLARTHIRVAPCPNLRGEIQGAVAARAVVEIRIAFSSRWSRGAPDSRPVYHGWGREKKILGMSRRRATSGERSGFDDSAAY